jgi:DNA polymerase III epsilon subunit-like protein
MYTFIDLEASNAFSRSSVCCIGLLRTDRQLNIINEELILVNPKDSFNLHHDIRGLDIGFTKADFKDKPTFDKVYGYLADTYFTKDTMVIGHAMLNDVRMLNAVCRKYKLPAFEFEFMCTQMLYKFHRGLKTVMSLAVIAGELNEEFHNHRADEDAKMSYLTLKRIVEESGKNLEELIEEYNIKKGEVKKGEVKDIFCTKNAIGAAKESKKGRKFLLNEFKRKVRKQPDKLFEGWFNGMRVCFDENLEIEDIDLMRDIIRHIVNGGGKYTSSVCECNIFVHGGGKVTDRLKVALSLPKKIKPMTKDEFYASLPEDMTRNDYSDDEETLRLIAVRRAKREYYGS